MLPNVSQALLTHLEATFPNRVPDLSTPDRVIWASVGAQQVLAHLRSLHETGVGLGAPQEDVVARADDAKPKDGLGFPQEF